MSAASIRELDRSEFSDLPADKKVLEARFELTNRGTGPVNAEDVIRSLDYDPVTNPEGAGEEARITGDDCPPDPDIELSPGQSAQTCLHFGLDSAAQLTGVLIYDSTGDGPQATLPVAKVD